METLKKLAVELRATDTYGPDMNFYYADTLNAYIKAQESAEPVAEILVGINKHVVDVKRQKTDLREGWHKVYAAPPPREPITRDALAQRMPIRPEFHEICEALRALGIEVKP